MGRRVSFAILNKGGAYNRDFEKLRQAREERKLLIATGVIQRGVIGVPKQLQRTDQGKQYRRGQPQYNPNHNDHLKGIYTAYRAFADKL